MFNTASVFLWIIVAILKLRRIVPTNVVHIVQRGSNTVSYGVGKQSNVYYQWPTWMPFLGVEVRQLPVSNFDIDLKNYSAYDKDRVPFLVDVKAFFHIADTNVAAAKVESFEELRGQLENVVQGAVRSILAKSKLEEIMEERSVFGEQFTKMVNADLANWGVESIKNIELMDVRDGNDSNVIHQIMAKRMSAIDKESRIEVAKNKQEAEEAELEANKMVAIKKASTERESGEALARSQQAVGIAKAESQKASGIALQESAMEVAKAEKATAEQQMEVIKINSIKQAEIDKERAIIIAEQNKKQAEIDAQANKIIVETEAQANKVKIEMDAEARLEAQKRDAEGKKTIGEAEAEVVRLKGTSEAEIVRLKGTSEAEARKLMELASVTAQTTLAQEIGDNDGYQTYLIRLKEVEANQAIGIKQAEANAMALGKADIKLMVNSGDVHSGMSKLSDLFTSKGGSQLNGLIESLKQTDEGKSILSLLENIKKD